MLSNTTDVILPTQVFECRISCVLIDYHIIRFTVAFELIKRYDDLQVIFLEHIGSVYQHLLRVLPPLDMAKLIALM